MSNIPRSSSLLASNRCNLTSTAQALTNTRLMTTAMHAAQVFHSAENFTAAVLAAPLLLEPNRVQLVWATHKLEFFPSNASSPEGYRLPTLNDEPVEVGPQFAYNGPHLNADVDHDARVVRASYGNGYVLEYDFGQDVIRQVPCCVQP